MALAAKKNPASAALTIEDDSAGKLWSVEPFERM